MSKLFNEKHLMKVDVDHSCQVRFSVNNNLNFTQSYHMPSEDLEYRIQIVWNNLKG